MTAIPIQCMQINFTQTADSTQTLGGVQVITMRTSADCYVDFDQPVAPTTSFKLLSANTADTTIGGSGMNIQKIHVQGVAGSGTIYLIVVAN